MAQEARWHELTAQVEELDKQGKYSDAIPVAEEALRVAESTFGPEHPNVAKSLNNLAEIYRKQARYAEAEPLYKRALATREKALGPQHPDVAESLNDLAELYMYQGRYAEAEPLFKRTLAICEKALGPDHLDVATSLNNLAQLHLNQGRYAEAEPLDKHALAIREKVLGPDHPDVAGSLNSLAVLYDDQGRYAEAEPLYKHALAIYEKTVGPNHPEVATSLNNLAFLYDEQGRYAEAEPLYKRALAIREKVLGPDHPDVAGSLNNLAGLYFKHGRYVEAEPLFKRALTINVKVLGPEHPHVATSLNNLALLYDDEGRYAEAEPLYKRALTISEKVQGPEHPDVAIGLNNLAEFYDEQGRYAEAELLDKRALAIREKALGPDHPDVATSLNNLALLYLNQGRYAEAELLDKRALAISEKVQGSEHPDVATSLNNLALVYLNQERYAEAEPLDKRALAIREKVLGPEHADVAQSLDNLARLYDNQGRYADAEPLHERALAIREKALGPEHPYVAISLNNLAALYRNQGRYANAEPLFKRTLAICEKVLGPDHPYVATSLHNLALLYYAEKSPQQASTYFDRSLAVLSHQFDYYFSYMSERDRLAFLSTVSGRFPRYFNFCLSYDKQLPDLPGKMYDVILWEKGFIAQSVAAVRAQIEASGDKEALARLNQLAAKKTQLAKLLASQPKDREEWRKQVHELEKETNDIENGLVRRSATFAEQKKLARVSWREVQKSLKPGEAAVEIVRFPHYDGKKFTDSNYYVALIVTPETTQPALVVLADAKNPNPLEKGALRNYRQNIGLQQASKSEANTTNFYEVFWKPLESALAGSKRIYLSPDGALNQVSLAVVPDSNGKLLVERYDLRIVNSTKDILRENRASSANSAVLIGNPAFGLDPAKQREAQIALQKGVSASLPARASAAAAPSDASATASTAATTSTKAPAPASAAVPAPADAPSPLVGVRGGRSRDLRGGVLDPLPGAQIELRQINSLLEKQNWSLQLFTEQNALKDSVKRVQHPRVLHIATHGFFEPDQAVNLSDPAGSDSAPAGLEDPMLRSGLFFAGANRTLAGESTPEDLDDGILTAYEATGLNLQGTELVVLSACDTGRGEVAAGEGVFGLRRALQVAGADSVLLSMWSVPDKETQELMTLFYKNWLAGKDKPTALRDAQLELRKTVIARYGKDSPFYWGAFVLVGR